MTEENNSNDDNDRQQLITELSTLKKNYKKSAGYWRVSYRILLVLSAVLSAAAAIIVQVASQFTSQEFKTIAEALAVIFPASVTVIATIIATLDFDTNWRVNRTAWHHTDILLIDLSDPSCDTKKIREDLKNIIKMRLDAFEKSD